MDEIFSFRLFIPAGKATIMPPLGPILAQYGINSVQFCTDFNMRTGVFFQFYYPEFDLLDINIIEGFDDTKEILFQLVVDITIFSNKTYSFFINTPTVRFMLCLFLKIKRCRPNGVVARLDFYTLALLAVFKFPNLTLYSSSQLIRGTARSLGVKILTRTNRSRNNNNNYYNFYNI
jgi:ribosomal protein L11